jgi:hypothetical protein
MTVVRHFLCYLIVIFLITGCSTLVNPPIAVGEPEQSVVAKLGKPTHRYREGNNHLLEYMTGPWGQQTYMARIGPDDRLISYEQVLTSQKFASIQVGKATKEDVLRTIGAPSDVSTLPLKHYEVWSYPYRENDVWDSIMYVHFDQTGIVRELLNGPDLRRDPDTNFLFGGARFGHGHGR